MSNETAEVFKKISHADDRSRIAGELITHSAQMVCKASAHDELFSLEAIRLTSEMKMICGSRGVAIPVQPPVSVVVSFSIGSDKYFLTSLLSEKWGGQLELDFSVDLFHLQRRQAYRIRIPESYAARFEIKYINGAEQKISAQIQDLSSAGLRIVCPLGKNPLKTGDVLEGFLRMGRRDELALRARIQHQKVGTSKTTQEMGVALVDLTPSLESRLFAITMELHRDLLAKLGPG